MVVARPAKVLVIGAGIGGLTCAVALRRVGIDVEVYERATELRAAGSGLSVMSNAVTALAALGIDLDLDKRGQVMESFTMLDRRGRLIRDLPFKEVCDEVGAPTYCLSRPDLQEALLAQAGDCPVHLGATAAGFEADGAGVTVRFADGRSASADVLVGADGFHSAVRRQLVGPEAARDCGYLLWLGLVDFQHPRMTTGSVRHYWGRGQRFGLIDLGHGRCYWWAATCSPAVAPARDRVKDTLRRAYAGWAEEVRAVIDATPQEEILTADSRDRAFLQRWGEGRVTLLGDAAHPMLTTLGQGAAMAIEDAVVLARTLSEPGLSQDPALALRAYEGRRRERTRQMVAGSRTSSDLVQAARPGGSLLRDGYYRLTPRHVLARQAEQGLTFPDGPTAEPGVVRRALSPVERLYWIVDQTSPLNVLARARVHGHLPLPLQRRSLDILQLRHPLLRVAIADDGAGTHPAFVPVDGRQIPLRHVDVPADDPAADTRWEREVNETELGQSVDWRTGPLLRAVVITRSGGAGHDEDVHDLLLTAPHIIADGKTCLSLLREWIELAADLDSGTPHQATSRRVLPATEDLLPRRHRGAAGIAGLRAMLLRDHIAARHSPAQRIIPGRQVPPDQRRTQMVHRTLTGDQVEQLAQTATRHGSTVHGALAAALVTAVARDAGTPAAGYFSLGSPVDFRGDLVPAVAPDEVGTYVATVPTRVRYEPGAPLWPTARAISRDLVQRRRRQDHLATISLARWAGPGSPADAESFTRFMDEKGPINLCLSNVGRYEFPDRAGPWRVSDAQFVAGVSVMGAIVATVNSSHGQLAWNFSYIEDLVSPMRARNIADESIRTVLSALSG
ncbi:MAG TPA: FAD-dependent monooxygenase [Actinocrinis sp.]|nr:FAD-dependent monooxygenase [Actinocrinis sp.]